MKKFLYKSKGTADDWTEDVIEAESQEDAQKKLDEIFGVKRDKNGKQTNAKWIQIQLLGEKK